MCEEDQTRGPRGSGRDRAAPSSWSICPLAGSSHPDNLNQERSWQPKGGQEFSRLPKPVRLSFNHKGIRSS